MKAKQKIKDEIIKRSEIRLKEISTKEAIMKQLPVLGVSLFSYITYMIISFQKEENFTELVLLVLSWSIIGFFYNLSYIRTKLALSKTEDMSEKTLKLLKKMHELNVTYITILNMYVPALLFSMNLLDLNIESYIVIVSLAILHKIYETFIIVRQEKKENIPFVLYEAAFYEKTKVLNTYIKERNNYTNSTNDEYAQKLITLSKVELLNETISEYKDSDMLTRVKIKTSIDSMIDDVIMQIKENITIDENIISAFERKSKKIKEEA